MNTERLLTEVSMELNDILQDNLVGIYLHGSLAMGCFNPNRSDIDLLVVVHHKLTGEIQRLIAQSLLTQHDKLTIGGGYELSVILASAASDFIYPTPFEFHYSNAHRERYRMDENYICGGYTDPDLAAHLTIAYHRGRTLLGQPLQSVLQPINPKYYVQSIMNDIEEAPSNITSDPVYYTLNLCRVLMYVREGTIASKQEGGEWGQRLLPQFAPIISYCLDQYKGEATDENIPSDTEFIRFAELMLQLINDIK